MSEFFQKVTQYYNQKLPFVIYSKPNTSDSFGLFQQDSKLYILENYKSKGFVLNAFDSESKFLFPLEKCVQLSTENDFEVSEVNSTLQDNFSKETKQNFETLVSDAIAKIDIGVCTKIVVSRKEIQVIASFDLVRTFQKLVQFYPTAFTYCAFHPEIGLWIGASPEQLLKVKENSIQTVALAGTKTKDKIDEVWGEKEVIEQQLVTDFIIENLKPFISENLVSEPYTYQAGNLLHIKTDISAQLKEKSHLGEVLNILHPTPAVCGFPKDKAKDFILENEGYNREFYAGFLGELNYEGENQESKNSDLFVNLRCMKIENNIANIYVGCGIIKDSNPELEFFETVNKSKTIKKVL